MAAGAMLRKQRLNVTREVNRIVSARYCLPVKLANHRKQDDNSAAHQHLHHIEGSAAPLIITHRTMNSMVYRPPSGFSGYAAVQSAARMPKLLIEHSAWSYPLNRSIICLASSILFVSGLFSNASETDTASTSARYRNQRLADQAKPGERAALLAVTEAGANVILDDSGSVAPVQLEGC